MTSQETEERLRAIEESDSDPVSSDEDLETAKNRQYLKLRSPLFWMVIGLMIVEVAAMFVIAFFQGFGHFCGMPFQLEHWVLASIEAGILLQTFGLAKIIAKALFQEESS